MKFSKIKWRRFGVYGSEDVDGHGRELVVLFLDG
jgi:hypothetical protein